MTTPAEDLASAIIDLAAERDIVADVHEAPPAQLVAPCLVVTTDSPWMLAPDLDQPFGRYAERYRVIVVASASDPRSAQAMLRDLVRLARDAADSLASWHWNETGGIAAAEDSGIDYLAATVSVTYSAEE